MNKASILLTAIKSLHVWCFLCCIGFATASPASPLEVKSLVIDGQTIALPEKRASQSRTWAITNHDKANVQVDARFRLNSPQAQAGILLRAPRDSDNIDSAYRIIADGEHQRIYLAVNDVIISERQLPIKHQMPYWLSVRIQNNHVVVYFGESPKWETAYPVIDAIDNTRSAGIVGVTVESGEVVFENIDVKDYVPEKSGETYTNPVQLNCADPGLLHYKHTYYAYCTYTPNPPGTDEGIRLFTSVDLVNWQDRGFALNNKDAWGAKGHWAPDVIAANEKFYMYFAVNERIAVATADNPLGPFTQKQQVPMEPDSIKIDAHVFTDDDGQRYFYYVGFDNGNHIWGAKLNPEMTSVDESSITHLIAPQAAWETHMANVVEGPMVIKHNGLYYMTYSGSHFESPHYSVGYATAEHPLGPWKKYPFNPIMQSTSYAHGTAHHSLTRSPDGKEWFIVYHEHYDLQHTHPRKMAIDRIRFVPQEEGSDALQVWGPTLSPQPFPSNIKP
ncbi:family 43 glycosylhydrolase [Alteromonas pelagimontana]|uniref:Family 43 glycosylhydrolase n=1 Tax=Alteromonas pelagimontana TaxID=1858656 RepID=A0A6M4MF94_9ALTE|nr:glycoside hydrolase family 43 protein [Alteromonas pelagimontana]QJR81285.1 family 43 glycosylhydrolase [Alteromonas pelagimontana]